MPLLEFTGDGKAQGIGDGLLIFLGHVIPIAAERLIKLQNWGNRRVIDLQDVIIQIDPLAVILLIIDTELPVFRNALARYIF